MNDKNSFLARILTRGSRALAAYTAVELLELHPAAGAGFGADPLSAWQYLLAERLRELAAAVAAEDSAIFARQVEWATALLVARGVATEHVRASLEHLRQVVARELPDTVRLLAVEYIDRAPRYLHEQHANVSTRLQAETPESRLAAQYLLAILQGDSQRATRLVLHALDEGHSVRNLLIRVLLPAQVEVGWMWHADEINVAEEHFASATTKKVMAQLMSRAEFHPSNGKTMLAAGVAGNHVDIGLQAVADFFEMDGWRTIQLGTDVPGSDIVQAVQYFEADLLGLSASQSTQLETVRQTINLVRSADRGVNIKIIIGGFAFAGSEHLPLQLGADGYAPDPAGAVESGRHLVFGSQRQAAGEIVCEASERIQANHPPGTHTAGFESPDSKPTCEVFFGPLRTISEIGPPGHPE